MKPQFNTQKVPMSKNPPNEISFVPPFTFELEGVIDLAVTDATFVHISKQTGRYFLIAWLSYDT